MGKSAALVKSRMQQVRRRRAQRSHRVQTDREQRLAVDRRRLQRIARGNVLPPPEDTALLVGQFLQACRLPAPSAALRALIADYAVCDAAVEPQTETRANHEKVENATKQPPRGQEALTQMAEQLFEAQDIPLDVNGLDEDDRENEEGLPGEVGRLSGTVLQDILQSPCGTRVLQQLLRALVDTKIGANVCQLLLEQFELNDRLLGHHVACKMLSAVVQHGPPPVVHNVLELLRRRSEAASTPDGAARAALCCDRHVAPTIVQLLTRAPGETQRWLRELLRLDGAAATPESHARAPTEATAKPPKRATAPTPSSPATASAAPASRRARTESDPPPPAAGSKAKAKKEKEKEKEKDGNASSPASDPAPDDAAEGLRALIQHPVAWRVLAALAAHLTLSHRLRLLHRLRFAALVESKRGRRFAAALLSDELAEAEVVPTEVAEELEQLIEAAGGLLPEMSRDAQGNFVVQKLIRLVAVVPNREVAAGLLLRLVHFLGQDGDPAALHSLASHSIGVHVMATVIDTAFAIAHAQHNSNNNKTHNPDTTTNRATPSSRTDAVNHRVVEDAVRFMAFPKYLADATGEPNGSLLVRRLMPLIKDPRSELGKLLTAAVGPRISSLLYDPIGNLVVQEYFRVLGQEAASKFTQRLGAEEAVAISRHPAASHVLFALFDLVSPAARAVLCSTLRPHVVELATHVNGRFIVERLLQVSREVRDDLLRAFATLATAKGTQHVLAALLAHLDPRGRTHLLQTLLLPRLFDLATHPNGSIVIQKLMQSDGDVTEAVRQKLAKEEGLRNDLAQNFHGKFVVQMVEN